MEADGARAPRELTATAAVSRARARKEGACAARRLFRAGVPRPPSGPAHKPGVASAVPERPAARQLQTLTYSGPWKPRRRFVRKWSLFCLGRLLRNTLLLYSQQSFHLMLCKEYMRFERGKKREHTK